MNWIKTEQDNNIIYRCHTPLGLAIIINPNYTSIFYVTIKNKFNYTFTTFEKAKNCVIYYLEYINERLTNFLKNDSNL